MASPATPENPASPSPSGSRSLPFVDLPQEVQKEIIRHCSTRDLICVALVSKHFRHLAAAHLYRDFQIVFPDEDNPQFDTPVDALAGGFDTFVTSNYNYAQYLRTLCFDTLYMGDKAEVAYRPYLANLSCGKFMNTLLLLTLRKARALESFKWNIRVELSRPVYKELHQIPALSHVHIRLQAGPSQYETPPPLPYNVSHPTSLPVPAHVTPVTSLPPPPPPTFGVIQVPPPQGFYVPASTGPLPPLPKPPRARPPKKVSSAKEPPTLSGFKRLKSLAVLDIDTLDIVPELQACVRSSAGTLSKLKLSFSEKLASAARKPSTDPEPEDSDQEDELAPLPIGSQSHAQNEEMSGPARAFRAQEERKSQESVLARIFDVESVEKPQVVLIEKREKKGKIKSDQDLVDFIKKIATEFMGEANCTRDITASQDVIDMIGLATQKYLAEVKARKEKKDKSSDASDASSPSTSQPSQTTAGEVPAEASGPAVSIFDEPAAPKKGKEGQGDANPDDIDIEEPEEQLTIDPDDPPASEAPANEPAGTSSDAPVTPAAALANTRTEYRKALATLATQKAEYEALTEELGMFESQANTLTEEIRRWRASSPSVDPNNLAEAESRLLSFVRSVKNMQKEVSAHQVAVGDVETLPPGETDSVKEQAHTRHMRDYLRQTRGVALESLSIYLIPVRASVLSRAVDLRVLRRLTLLNVGIQGPIWALLHRENKEAPLPLRKIFTDNVSLAFLNFVASLEELHELFLLERETKAKPESFAPRTQTTMDQIRRLVLRKHLTSLRRLMIKNLADTTWDLNEKAILLLCRQGRKLEELACNIGIRAMHCLMQHIAGLASLRALHVVHLRNDDTCVWVMRETKRFLIDNVSHYPELKLEWIAIDEDDRVDRLVRVTDWDKKADGSGSDGKEGGKDKDKKGKEKQKATVGLSLSSLDLGSVADVDISAVIAAELGDEGSSTSSGSEDGETTEDEDADFLGQKIETVEAIPFCDVEGVRIFKKEIVAGRL